jgi:hypothetical protein
MKQGIINMEFRIDKTLQEYLDDALEATRPRRNGVRRDRNAVLAELLAEAEVAGDAMRYLDPKGRIAWKATPKLREYLEDLRADAVADAEAEEI